MIGIGGHLAVPPLPHHRAYGSRTAAVRSGLGCCVRQVQQIGHVERALADVQVNSSIPLFDRKGPSLRPDLPFGRAPRAAAVKDAAAKAAAPAEPAHSVLDRASTVLD